MARLGELLIEAKLLSGEQLAEALRAQVMFGGRLGTNLIELGYLDLDTLTRALGTQHGLPAALSRHFRAIDEELQDRLSAETAGRLECVPMQHVFGQRHGVVIATARPLAADQLALLAEELLVDPQHMIPAVTAELRIKYCLERFYDIPRAPRYLRVQEDTPGFEGPRQAWRERRRYLEDCAEQLIQSKQLARGSREILPLRLEEVAVADPARLARALEGIEAAADREQVAEQVLAVIDRFASGCNAAALLIVRGTTAIGWTSFSRRRPPPPDIAVPLHAAGLLAAAVRSGTTARCAADELDPVDWALLDMLGNEDGELVVVPIVLDDAVTSLVACATRAGANAAAIEACAAAAATALGRLMRDVTAHAVTGVDAR